jgi:non-specific serine/threonine protein kinase
LNTKLEVRLLGKFEASHNGKTIAITSRPAQSLFAYLILSAGTAHRREKLAGLLWPDSLEETAQDNLRHALWRVRKALESASSTRFLRADDLSIGFEKSLDYWVDAAALEHLNEKTSADQLMTVLSEYQGELLPGFYDEWVVLEREHLHSIIEHHMARLLSLLQEQNRWLDILDWGERWIRLGQKPEPAYQALMAAHAAKGDMSKVAAAYERCVKSLREFGIEPSEQTRTLYEKLKAGKASFEARPVIPIKGKRMDAPKTNLPVPLTSFIGREKEVDQVVKMLEKKRLVTLTGSSGVGKTRLAIQASNKLLNKSKDGVWWVDLVGLNDDSLVIQAVAQVANVREVPNQSLFRTLVDTIQTKHVLLVLDNCEHLIMGCARLAQSLLSDCPNLKILITSREMLGLTGETLWHVPALSLPDPEHISPLDVLRQYESISLFIERAVGVNSDFTLTEHNAPSVAQVCQRLDGIPLAIELAAARVKLLSVEKISARLDNRFDLLTSGSRTAFPRHRTLQAAIDWSYDLLPHQEQTLFRRLAVFVGGCTLEQAQAICSGDGIEADEILDLLTNLVDKSLVMVHKQTGGSRFQMLETIREYARKKSPDLTETRNRHLDFYMRFGEEIEPKLHGGEQTLWLNKLELEHDNLRAALDWSLTGGELESGLRLASVLWLFWDIHGYHLEGRVWLDRLLIKRQGPVPAPSTSAWARVLYVAGHLRQRQGDFEQARKQYTASLSIYQQLEDEKQVAVVLRGLGEIAQDEGDPVSAKKYYEQSLALCRSLDDIKGISIALGHLAIFAFLQSDYEQAAILCQETLAIGRERASNRTMAIALTTLGFVSWGMGELEHAETQFAEALASQAELTDKRVAQYSFIGIALVALGSNHPSRAARLFGAADSLREKLGTPLPPSQRNRYDLLVESIRAQLNASTFEKAWAEGRAMTLEQGIEFALNKSE